ncbi:hypothetical protein AMTR_s00028p00150530 [Amborella trichopoda]|uniref:Uncharacterized protein n=1 Tax=Amborella trichopoda TaxID=13333 RepID=W1PSB7_AMBTC|nr:hypothetical protein AMTR_s00028p00150530 [Amborella trichopoda]
MTVEEVLEAEHLLDPKFKEIINLRRMVVRLCRKAEHHQNMLDFYHGEVERVKGLSTYMKRTL